MRGALSNERPYRDILEPDNRRQSERIFHEKRIYFRAIGSKLAFSRRARHAYPQLKPSATQSLKNEGFWCLNVNGL
jgi:hypothetical protein